MAHVIVVLEEHGEETAAVQLSPSRVGLEANPGSDMPLFEVDRVHTAPSREQLFTSVAPTLAFLPAESRAFTRLILCVGPGSLDATVGDLGAGDRAEGLAPRCHRWLLERARQLRRDGCEVTCAVAATQAGDGSGPLGRKQADLLGPQRAEEGRTTWRPATDADATAEALREALRRRQPDASLVVRFALRARAPDGGANTLVVACAACLTNSEKLSASRVVDALADRCRFVPVRESKIARVVGEDAVAHACFVVHCAGDRTTSLDLLEFAKRATRLSGQERAAKLPTSKRSDLGRFPLVSADVSTSDHLSERSRSVTVVSGTRARGTPTLERR